MKPFGALECSNMMHLSTEAAVVPRGKCSENVVEPGSRTLPQEIQGAEFRESGATGNKDNTKDSRHFEISWAVKLLGGMV
jgi:hypothetical protein